MDVHYMQPFWDKHSSSVKLTFLFNVISVLFPTVFKS